ncbi:MAG: 2-succinyl-5-enolpyruvyl-6-hydroxy-3-cyclohexene-1-carboxylic-acid synthase [Acidimicrobiales bacterium]
MTAADRATTQATFCATLVDEWARAGLTDAIIAPGSRSTPMALALVADERVSVHVFHDERAAGFAALGVGLASDRPAVVLCTSGTAATHLHAAVVEAHLSAVPMLVCTADRPPEQRDVGAPQTIDQAHLYGSAVRWFTDPGVPDDAVQSSWRPLAARAYLEGTGAVPGPVHLNLPFREPLLGTPSAGPAGRPGSAPWVRRERGGARAIVVADAARLLVVAGAGAEAALASCGWPVLADPTSGLEGPNVIAHADALLRDPLTAERLVPDVIVRVGRPPASRVVNEWLTASGAEEWVQCRRWSDPAATAAHLIPPDASLILPSPPDDIYRTEWCTADCAAEDAIAATLRSYDVVTEPLVARAVVAGLPAGSELVVASSMPIRDVEWFAPRREAVRVTANRGANGIDGTIATAIGVALGTRAVTAVLLGDVAFLHDPTALVGLKARGVDLTIVVVDNDGGGIFSFLPQAESVKAATFERLYGTPHGVRPEDLAAAHGIASLTVEDPDALGPAIRSTVAAGGVWLIVARTDRAANVAVHAALNAAVAKAVAAGCRDV